VAVNIEIASTSTMYREKEYGAKLRQQGIESLLGHDVYARASSVSFRFW
jgi:hypothetical protein